MTTKQYKEIASVFYLKDIKSFELRKLSKSAFILRINGRKIIFEENNEIVPIEVLIKNVRNLYESTPRFFKYICNDGVPCIEDDLPWKKSIFSIIYINHNIKKRMSPDKFIYGKLVKDNSVFSIKVTKIFNEKKEEELELYFNETVSLCRLL